MATSLQNTATLANDLTFRNRVEAAMVTAGVNVASEALGTQSPGSYNLRHTLSTNVLNNPLAYLDRFAWAAAANPTVSGDLGTPVPIASTGSADPALVTTSFAHGLSTGAWVEIAGATQPALDGCWPVTVGGTATFTIPAYAGAAGGAVGTVVLHPPDADIQFAVNSVWSDIAGVGVGS